MKEKRYLMEFYSFKIISSENFTEMHFELEREGVSFRKGDKHFRSEAALTKCMFNLAYFLGIRWNKLCCLKQLKAGKEMGVVLDPSCCLSKMCDVLSLNIDFKEHGGGGVLKNGGRKKKNKLFFGRLAHQVSP